MGAGEAAKAGWPSRRRAEGTLPMVQEAVILVSEALASDLLGLVSEAIAKTTGLGVFCFGVLVFVGAVVVAGNGCSEHTNLVSTPAARSKAQKSWLPTSWLPSSLLEARI